MKKILALVAVGSFAVSAAYAQSSGIPSFSSETEKKAWIEAHPEQYRQAVKTVDQKPAPKVKADAQRIDTRTLNAQPVPATPVRAVNANVESKRLPANYPNPDNRTSKSDQ